ncbi:protocadherin delta 1 [Paragonimus westermani]|uniref:Protocadherin delta 1 n=1 Tax=Paragonimus westermani TaxID=34504 RepID=A0A5J4P1C2_9TREM|nr:protocadherin delta 1 [Paragonimus westermani]
MFEEQPVGFLVGILYKQLPDALLTGPGQLLFRVIQQGHSNLFTVGVADGRIHVAGRIDREALCPHSEQGSATLSTLQECQLTFTVNLLRLKESATDIADILRIFILVNDIDDHPCVFVPSENQTIQLSEDAPLNRIISINQPQDLDVGERNGIQKDTIKLILKDHDRGQVDPFPFALRIRKTESPTTPYSLDLVVQHQLDYEFQTSYIFFIEAGGFNDKICRLELHIHISDVNDNPPIFTKNFSIIEILETTSPEVPIYTTSATDADMGPVYSQLVYNFDPFASSVVRTTFRIDHKNGSIFLRRPLNYHRQSTYNIPLIVHNPLESAQPLSFAHHVDTRLYDRSQLQVHVIDVNDRPPLISVYTAEGDELIILPEHASDIPFDFAVVTVSDEDTGSNEQIDCSLDQPSSKQFRLIRISSTKRVDSKKHSQSQMSPVEFIYKLSAMQAFDREVVQTVPLKIFCRDFGTPQLSSVYVVNVHIADINDHAPRFNATKWRFSVTEDTDPERRKVDYFIGQLMATDLDSGKNAKLKYHIVERDYETTFTVDQNNGVIRSRGNLDREKRDHFQFTLQATDFGEPPLNGTTIVDVFIQDFNDESPVFGKQNYVFSVEENNGYGELVGSLHAMDLDEGINAMINFRLEVLNQDIRTGFSLSTQAKDVTNQLPFELISYFDTIQNTYEIRIYANKVIDRESIAGTTSDAPNTMGRAYLSSQLPASSAMNTVSSYKFWVVGEDDGTPQRRGQTLIQVFVKDVNDESPVFLSPKDNTSITKVSYRENVGHRLLQGQFITLDVLHLGYIQNVNEVVLNHISRWHCYVPFTQVYAVDADAGLNGTVRYKIEYIHLYNITNTPTMPFLSNTPNLTLTAQLSPQMITNHLFAVDENDGLVFLTTALTERDIGKLFSVGITAHDLGKPIIRSTHATTYIEIDDSNPVGSVNNHLSGSSKTVQHTELLPTRDDGSHLNFYIIISILAISFFVSALLIGGICIALKRRKYQLTRNVHVINANGSVGFQMRNELKQPADKQKDGVLTDTSNEVDSDINFASGKLPDVQKLDCNGPTSMSGVSTATAVEPLVAYSPQMMQLLNVQTCTGSLRSTQLSPLQMVHTSGEGIPQMFGTAGSLTRSMPISSESILLYSSPINPEEISPNRTQAATAELVPVFSQPVTVLKYAHPMEIQHLCVHPKQVRIKLLLHCRYHETNRYELLMFFYSVVILNQTKRNSLGSFDQDSGNGDSLDTNTISVLPISKSIWLPTSLGFVSTAGSQPDQAECKQHQHQQPHHQQQQAAFTLPLVHVYRPLSCVNEMENVPR